MLSVHFDSVVLASFEFGYIMLGRCQPHWERVINLVLYASLRKHAPAIYRDFFSPVKIENFIRFFLYIYISYFCLKHRSWVNVRTVSPRRL